MGMAEFIMRQFPREKGSSPSKYELTLQNSIKGLNLHNYVIRFAALFCGNLLKMMQLAKEEKINFMVVSYHELKDETASEMKKILQHCQLDFGDNFQVYNACLKGPIYPPIWTPCSRLTDSQCFSAPKKALWGGRVFGNFFKKLFYEKNKTGMDRFQDCCKAY